jgi:hypothetical protein
MNLRISPLAAVLAAAVLAAPLSGPAVASGKPLKAKVEKAPDDDYAGADGRKNT